MVMESFCDSYDLICLLHIVINMFNINIHLALSYSYLLLSVIAGVDF